MRKLALTALALAGILSLSLPASASSVRMCGPIPAGAAPGPAQVKAVTSGTNYSTNNRGCALVAQTDVGDFNAMGFTADSTLQSMVVSTGVLVTTGSVQVASLPASAFIQDIFIDNTTANAVTGGIDIGKTTGAADIVSAKVCAANCLTSVLDSAILLRVFSKTAAQPIWVTGHTDGNSANLTMTIVYGFF